MTIARHYVMTAPADRADALEAALGNLAGALKQVPGFEGADILQDTKTPTRFILIEKWESIDAHKAAGQHLPPDALEELQSCLAGRPEGAYLTYLYRD